jgi:5,6,7,8-tetrahydromethanopterin hydro-lyase
VTGAFGIRIGEAFAGDGAEAAHVNIVIGDRSELGPTFALALASPSAGHTPFVTVLRPGLPVKPMTLFVNKAAIANDEHGNLTWGAAQAGVAVGITDAVAASEVLTDLADDLVAIAAVWVSPHSRDEAAVFANNIVSARDAVAAALAGGPTAADVLAERDECHNPFFDARPLLAAQLREGNVA